MTSWEARGSDLCVYHHLHINDSRYAIRGTSYDLDYATRHKFGFCRFLGICGYNRERVIFRVTSVGRVEGSDRKYIGGEGE